MEARNRLIVPLLIFQAALLAAFLHKFPISMDLIRDSIRIEPFAFPTKSAFLLIVLTLGKWVLMVATSYGVGEPLLGWLGGNLLTPSERKLLAVLLGFVILGYAVFGLGICGFYRPAIFWFLPAVALLTRGGSCPTVSVRRKLLPFADAQGRQTIADLVGGTKTRLYEIVSDRGLKFFLAFFLLPPLVMLFVPEVFYDSLVYHLGLPHLYLLEGRYVDTPFVHFSRFPMLVHMLYVWALAWGGEALAKTINVTFLLCAVGLLHNLASRNGLPPKLGLPSSLLFLSIPVVQMNAWSTAVDIPLSTFALASLACAALWHLTPGSNRRLLILSGVFGGAVLSTKYTGGFFALSALAFLGVSGKQRKEPWEKIAVSLAIWAGAAFALILPWLIRNAVLSGNPVYPFLHSWFGGRCLDPEKFASEVRVSLGYSPPHFWGWLGLPWQLSLKGPGAFDFLGPAVVAFLPCVIRLKLKGNLHKPLNVMLGVYFAVGLFFSREARYLLPGVCLTSLVVGFAVAQFENSPGKGLYRSTLSGLFLLSMGVLAVWNLAWLQLYEPWSVITGREPRSAYVSRYHPGMNNPYPPDPIFADIAKLSPTARVLFIGEEKVYRCPRPFIYSNVYDKTPIVEWSNPAASADDLHAQLRSEKITHLLLNLAEAQRLKGYRLFPWSPHGARVFREFWKSHIRLTMLRDTDHGPAALMLLSIEEKGAPGKAPELSPAIEQALDLTTISSHTQPSRVPETFFPPKKQPSDGLKA